MIMLDLGVVEVEHGLKENFSHFCSFKVKLIIIMPSNMSIVNFRLILSVYGSV